MVTMFLTGLGYLPWGNSRTQRAIIWSCTRSTLDFKWEKRENFFAQRVINMCNSLLETVVSASTVSIFKENLDDVRIA